MFGEEKNLKDISKDSIKDTFSISITKLNENMGFRFSSYNKVHKLITALYMVTDVMDKEEPLRSKLRTLGVEIVSDINTVPFARTVLANRVEGVMSFLDIAGAMNLISEMNCSILKKEFIELKRSIEESEQIKPIWLEEFLKTEVDKSALPRSKGHTSIGVQKGSTLMKALANIKDINRNKSVSYKDKGFRPGFDELKEQRRNQIVSIIKGPDINGSSGMRGATITDIKTKATGLLASCGEKTLQRELISMVKDGVLNKTGKKRWSRYFVKN